MSLNPTPVTLDEYNQTHPDVAQELKEVAPDVPSMDIDDVNADMPGDSVDDGLDI